MTSESKRNFWMGVGAALLIAFIFFLFAPKGCTQTLTDSRDSQVYTTVTIGTQTWMAENLNYEIDGYSWCYQNDTSACTDYGRLYNFLVVDSVCPSGWHVPTDAEWQTLESYIGMSDADTAKVGYRSSADVGDKLKAIAGSPFDPNWHASGGGSDDYDFAVKGGGIRSSGVFQAYLYNTSFWTSTAVSSQTYHAYCRDFYYNFDGIGRNINTKANGYYIRCIQDQGD